MYNKYITSFKFKQLLDIIFEIQINKIKNR